jgi:hypothetical protein
VLLFIIAGVEGVAGLALLFATGWVLSFAPHMLTGPFSAFLVALVKGTGILALAIGYLLCVTARDPVRYVAVLDALIFILAAASALNAYAVFSLHLGAFYPAPYLLGRGATQLLVAIALFALRPREVRSTQPA